MSKTIEFFCPLKKLPTVTSQSKGINTATGSVFDSKGLKDAKASYESHLAKFAPIEPLTGPLGIEIVFCYPTNSKHKHGDPYTQKPDWDNASKLLQDVLAHLRFMKDDKQIAKADVVQMYSDIVGVYVRLSELEENSPLVR